MSKTVNNLPQQLGGGDSPAGESTSSGPTDPNSGGADGRSSESGGGGPDGPPVKIDPTVMKANVARFVKQTYGDSPEKAVRVMKTIYGGDYDRLDLPGLEERLQVITAILEILDKSDMDRDLIENVRERIQAGIDQLPKDVLDDIVIDGVAIKIWQDNQEKVIGKSDENLLNLIDTAKDRSANRKKMRVASRTDGQFTNPDYEQLSETFNLSIREAEIISRLLNGCFDDQGNFQRAIFVKNIPGFAEYPQSIFEILWEFLREIPRRSDRLPFMNSLQFLGKEIGRPMQAVKILVSDFILDPGDISFPDRNALMLAIQFLRTYNKELKMDIEVTPKEVMKVTPGMDPEVTRYTAWKIDGEQKRFVEKMVTIRRRLIKSFEHHGSDLKVLPIGFLLALEREAHLFLALVGGKTATAVIRSALNVYGNPAAQIFLLKESAKYMKGLLQQLDILIRVIGRIGQEADVILLDDIQKRQQGFMDLSEEPRHAALVSRILGEIDSAKDVISSRMKNDD